VKYILVALLAAALVAVASAASAGPPPCEDDCVIGRTPPVAGSPFGITRGPLGSIWFSLDNAVARIDRQGDSTVYPVPTPNPNVGWMATDPGSNVWFAERLSGKIGRITPDGAITEYSLPSAAAIPQGLVFAHDGNVYVSEQGANAIARLDPVTGASVDFPVPTPNSTVQSGTLGPDGAVWFIERAASKVARMSLDGQFTEYALTPGAFPNRIVTGPDGAMWFSELRANKIGRITTDGTITEYPMPGGPVGVTFGKDGQLYVDMTTTPGVARMNLDGVETGRWLIPQAAGPLQIATGFGLDVWITDTAGGRIFELTPYATGR
jgi:streptogramin lyase